jgi:hypothetical protein
MTVFNGNNAIAIAAIRNTANVIVAVLVFNMSIFLFSPLIFA